MLLGPLVENDDLENDYRYAGKQRQGRSKITVHPEAPAVEDGAADDGGHQIVGQRHPAEEADVREALAEPCEAVPQQGYSRYDEQQDAEVEERTQQAVDLAEADVAVVPVAGDVDESVFAFILAGNLENFTVPRKSKPIHHLYGSLCPSVAYSIRVWGCRLFGTGHSRASSR